MQILKPCTADLFFLEVIFYHINSLWQSANDHETAAPISMYVSGRQIALTLSHRTDTFLQLKNSNICHTSHRKHYVLCSIEASHRDDSNEYPQHMFSMRNKKTSAVVYHAYPGQHRDKH